MAKKSVWLSVGGLGGLALVYLAGPRVAVDTTLRPIDLPTDLDAYLRQAEARRTDIVPGAEKTIIWAGEPGRKTPFSVVYLHGFSATRQETAPLADEVAAALGANLYYARLTGHGRSSAALAEATVNDWLNDAHEALAIGRRLGERVILIGMSTGGTAAAWLAAQPANDDLHALVLLAPNFAPQGRQTAVLTWPWAEHIARRLIGPVRHAEPTGDDRDRYWTNDYPVKALLPMMGLVKLARRAPLERAAAPLLVIYDPQDQVVDPRYTDEAFARYGGRKERFLVSAAPPRHHVLAGDIVSPQSTAVVRQAILDFLATLPAP